MSHTWTENDEIIGLYLYRFGEKSLPCSKEELAKDMGMGWDSMGLKIANFRHLDGQGGLPHYTAQCETIFLRYKNTPDTEFEIIGLEAVVKATEKRYKHLQFLLSQKREAEHSVA